MLPGVSGTSWEQIHSVNHSMTHQTAFSGKTQLNQMNA